MKIDTSKRMTVQQLRENLVIFHPETPEEAESLQRRLFGLGFLWKNGSDQVQSTTLLSEGTLVLRDGQMGWNKARVCTGILRTIEDLPTPEEEKNRPKPFTVNEDMSPREQFALLRKMAARIQALEEEVYELRKEVKGDQVEIVKLPIPDRDRRSNKDSGVAP